MRQAIAAAAGTPIHTGQLRRLGKKMLPRIISQVSPTKPSWISV
jgi:hypothetical protein